MEIIATRIPPQLRQIRAELGSEVASIKFA